MKEEKSKRDDRVQTATSGLLLRPSLVIAIVALLILQLWLVWDKLDRSFADTRFHYNYDNALFSYYARSGNKIGGLRSQFGMTNAEFTGWGVPSGSVGYYTHHPFLMKAIFQQCTRFIGYSERVSRTYSLAISFAILVGVFLLIFFDSESIGVAFMGAATLASIPLFAVFQTCVKFDTDGMLLAVWQLVAVSWYLKWKSHRALIAVAVFSALGVLAFWTATVFITLVAIQLLIRWWRYRERSWLLALAATIGGLMCGVFILLLTMILLKGGLQPLVNDLKGAVTQRFELESVTFKMWAIKQIIFVKMNFGFPLVITCAVISILGGILRFTRFSSVAPTSQPSLAQKLALVASFATGIIWVFAFRQGSYIHGYWQYPLCIALALVVSSFVNQMRSKRKLMVALVLSWCVLFVHLQKASANYLDSTLKSQLGTEEDIAFLKSIRGDSFDKMVFVPHNSHYLNEWFQGPLFQYYTDRAVSIYDPRTFPGSRDKVLVLKDTQGGEGAEVLGLRLGVHLTNEKCGQRICAYDVVVSP